MNLMNRGPLTAELRSVDLFQECSARELRQIARLTTGIEVPAARVLCVEGAIGAEFFVILRGSAWVERRGKRIAFLKPGQAFGEVALLSRNGRCRRTATVVAAEPMSVLVFSRAEFNVLVRDVPAVARRLLERVSGVALSIAAEQIRAAQSAPSPRRDGVLSHSRGAAAITSSGASEPVEFFGIEDFDAAAP
jgi:CRP/FNR family transcriptional regulator, cyclic AMP receptor protein